MNEQTALIIIDMQQGMTSPALPPRNNPGAEDNIARLLAAWRQARQPVVCVRHISRSSDSVFAPGQPGAAFQKRFKSKPRSGWRCGWRFSYSCMHSARS